MRVVFASVLMAASLVYCGRQKAPDGPADPSTSGAAPRWSSCGDLSCRQYDSLADAFLDAIAPSAGVGPLVVSFGEAHAQKGAKVASAASHFTTEILPLLAGRASDLLVEIQKPPVGCNKATATVRKEQEVVTTAQAPTDQNEYVAMGAAARARGIIPDLLRPTCADLDAIAAAGDDAIDLSLRTIERLTEGQVEKLLAPGGRAPADQGKMVVTYGGALHNTLAPSKERAAWSFGPALDAYTHGRYLEVDLYVPEFIEDTDAWKRLPFYAHYDPKKLGGKTTVFRDGKAITIVLAKTVSAKRAAP